MSYKTPLGRQQIREMRARRAKAVICSHCAVAIEPGDEAGLGGCAAPGCDAAGFPLCGNCLEDHDCNGGES